MDLSSLKPSILQKIFSYLPLDDCIRGKRISKKFHQISSAVISETKTLNLSEEKFDRLTYLSPTSLANLLVSCSENLETIKFPEKPWPLLITTFSQFSCPNLAHLDLANAKIGNDVFGEIMRKNRNLKTVIWNAPYTVEICFPPVVNERLEHLKMNRCNNDTFRSLTGTCPNLKSLEIYFMESVNGEAFDQFFGHTPNLETLIIRNFLNTRFVFPSLARFWRLPQLRTLILTCSSSKDQRLSVDAIINIAYHFPQLEILESNFASLTNQSIEQLINLRHLRRVSLADNRQTMIDIDLGIRYFVQLDNLEEVTIDACVSPMTFSSLVRYCNRLRFLKIRCVDQVYDIDRALLTVGMFKIQRGRKLRIAFMDTAKSLIWQSERVCDALDHQAGGVGLHEVTFE